MSKAQDPREAALVLFQQAQLGRTELEHLSALIAPGESARERAALADLLASLRRTARATIVAHEAIDAARTAVDLRVELPGGGQAEYTVHTARGDDGSWRVTAILGPDAAWPPAPARSGEGLTTSAPDP